MIQIIIQRVLHFSQNIDQIPGQPHNSLMVYIQYWLATDNQAKKCFLKSFQYSTAQTQCYCIRLMIKWTHSEITWKPFCLQVFILPVKRWRLIIEMAAMPPFGLSVNNEQLLPALLPLGSTVGCYNFFSGILYWLTDSLMLSDNGLDFFYCSHHSSLTGAFGIPQYI